MDNAPAEHPRWDRFWLAVGRHGVRRMERRPTMAAVYERAKRRSSTPLSRFGDRHPVLGGVVAGIVWGGAMFLIFSVLTLFRFEQFMAMLWGVGGVFFGTAMAWSWSYKRKHGRPPSYP